MTSQFTLKGPYREWDAKRQHISCKKEMQDEMAAARCVFDSRDDFITIMQDYGYEIARQEPNSITVSLSSLVGLRGGVLPSPTR